MKTMNVLTKIKYFSGAAVCALIITACSSASFPDYSSGLIPLYEQPSDWKDLKSRENVFSVYTPFLTGKKIFLDPGHGGADRKNRSRNGKIVEADVNLRVALHLKGFLEKTGAVVFLSRTGDETVDLNTRSRMANESGAEIFISIHHNAGGSAEDYSSNYTSTFYHSNEDNFNFEPATKDLARYIQRDLAYAMRNSGGLGSFDGTYSDYVIYPGDGFAVLRNSKIPAVLIECSFHSSRFEEARLGYEEFNEIEAWGIFKGISKYYRAGRPEIVFEEALSSFNENEGKLIFTLKDKAGIEDKSVKVFCDSVLVNHYFNPSVNILEVPLSGIKKGEKVFRVIASNRNRNFSFPFYKTVTIN